MKHIFAIIVSILFFTTTSFAQEKTVVADTIHVDGVCGQCKERIENAAYIKGVKRADWNKKTKQLIVIYSSKKTTINKIETSIAKAGHNAGEVKALPQDYKKLPSCCAYKDSTVDTH